ncbi:hypothetical protein R3P38DRAFT_3219026 [Favolaschia claudopus]|uniref:Uncharacterized protein n=1 Tax=Favolaschia claudopus TaxID=2862362 RepID=A0AAW0A3D8_9AGAR
MPSLSLKHPFSSPRTIICMSTPDEEVVNRILELIGDTRIAWPIDCVASRARHSVVQAAASGHTSSTKTPPPACPTKPTSPTFLVTSPIPSSPPPA